MSWLPKQKVVVPVDFSEHSFAAVELAREEFVENAAGLHLVHVLPTLSPNEPGVVWDTVNDEEREQHAEQGLRERFAGDAWKDATFHVTIGTPSNEITRYAEEIGADMIILPSHGRTGLSRLLIGSVAERVVRLAHCPVLVLRD